MSYYGIRKQKFIEVSKGLWNITCEYYDSSIRDYNNNRVWNKCELLYKNSLPKTELEYLFFCDVVDGNIHGASGKFSCANWGNRKFNITESEQEELDNLYKTDYNKYKELRHKYLFKAWQEYLKNEKEKSKLRNNYYIVELNYKEYSNIYVKSKSAYTTKFSYYLNNAKVFKKTISELKEMFCSNNNFTNIKAYNVSEYITTRNNKKILNQNLIQQASRECNLQPIKLSE